MVNDAWDDMIRASEAPPWVYQPKMISSFPSGLACLRRAKPEGKKEIGWGGLLPRAAASAALPGAIIMPPLTGLRKGEPAQERRVYAAEWEERPEVAVFFSPAILPRKRSAPIVIVVFTRCAQGAMQPAIDAAIPPKRRFAPD